MISSAVKHLQQATSRRLLLTATAAAALLLAAPLQEFALLLAQGLTTTLIDLGSGWLALIFAPINNIASLIVPEAIRRNDAVFDFKVSPPFIIDEASLSSNIGSECEQCVFAFVAEHGCLNHTFELPNREQQS